MEALLKPEKYINTVSSLFFCEVDNLPNILGRLRSGLTDIFLLNVLNREGGKNLLFRGHYPKL